MREPETIARDARPFSIFNFQFSIRITASPEDVNAG